MEHVANIGIRERVKWYVLGISMLLVGIGLTVTLVATGAAGWLRIIVFLPFLVGTLGVFQARARIGVDLAQRWARNMGAGEEKIESYSESIAIRNRALRVYIEAVIAAAALTAFCMIIPNFLEQ